MPTEAGERGGVTADVIADEFVRGNIPAGRRYYESSASDAYALIERCKARALAAEQRLRRVEEALRGVVDFPVAKFDGFTIERIKDVARDALDPKTPDE